MTTPNAQHRNEVHLAGYLVRDPELRYTPSGKPVASFTVGTKFEQRTEFHRCVAWEAQAEKLAEHFRKGNFVKICGRLQTRSWDDKQSGQKRYITEVVAWNLSDGEQTEAPKVPQKSEPVVPNIHGVAITNDDIPF